MGKYYTDLVLFIDVVLFGICISLAFLIIVYTFFKRINIGKRRLRLMSIISALQNLTLDHKESIIEGCLVLIKDTTAFEFLDIARQKENLLPNKFYSQLNECINSSGKVERVERIAQKSIDKWRRIEAIISLGYLKSPNGLAILKKSVFNKDEDIAYFSLLSLGHMKDVESAGIILEALRKHVFSGYKIASILEQFPADILNKLIKATEEPNHALRFWSIKIISRFKPKQYAEEIASLIDDESPDIRAASCECLGEIREESTKESVKKCLNDKIWFVRMHAIRALEKILDERCLVDIAGFLEDADWFVRENVKKIMIKHIEASLIYIERFLNEGNQSVKQDCLEILDSSGYTGRILEEIDSESSEIKNRAQHLLKAMIKAGSHFGFEAALSKYPQDLREKILMTIAALDKRKAEHIDKKIKGEIVDI